MSVIDKVQALGIPEDQYVVIGSGLLDARGLREVSDVGLVVTDGLFDRLSQDKRFRKEHRNLEKYRRDITLLRERLRHDE